MSVQITIRNVPDETRDRLAERAASRRQSMQQFLLGELERLAQRPETANRESNREILDRARKRLAITGTRLSAETIVNAIKEGRELGDRR